MSSPASPPGFPARGCGFRSGGGSSSGRWAVCRAAEVTRAARIRRSAAFVLCGIACASSAGAMPDLASRRVEGSMIVFADDRRADLFYYAPLDLRLVTGADGRPEFSLLEMRYTGRRSSSDRGLILHRSLVTLRVQLPAHNAVELARCAHALGTAGRPAELRPLPIRRVEAALVYVAIGASSDTSKREVRGGRMQGSRQSEGPPDEGYWNERVFTAGVDSLTAQVLHATLAKGQLSMSLAFAFVADGRVAREPWGAVDGPPELAEALEQQLGDPAGKDSTRRDSTLRRVVAAGAIPITVDLRRWPDLVKRADVDGDSPSGFPAL